MPAKPAGTRFLLSYSQPMPRTPIDDPAEREFLRSLGVSIRERRQLVGLSQKAVAEKAGLTRTFVTELENGQVNVSVLALRQIALALGTDLLELTLPPRSELRRTQR